MTKDGKDESSDRLDDVIDRFTQAIRSGDTPSLSSFVNDNPDLESEIRELLPLVSMVEGAGKQSTDRSQASRESSSPPTIEGYSIRQEIGRGGMGVVYEAEQLSPRRRVAIKVLSFSSDQLARERFRREADSAARLQHANVIPVFEVGQTSSDVIYYSMQLVDGFALDQIRDQLNTFRSASANANSLSNIARSLIDSRRFSDSNGGSSQNRRSFPRADSHPNDQAAGIYYNNVAAIIKQVAEAVEYSHSKGIIHRDIKPSNVLIGESGHVWVSDFGLAKLEDDDLTRTGDVVGSVRYMSPERFAGKCDERADVYSLGVTLYELLTLQPPFSSPDKLQIIQQICSRDPVAPSVIDRRIPIDLETIVLKAMSKEPERRYASARDFADDLQRFIRDQPIHARRLNRLEKTLRWATRNKTLAVSLAVTVIACALVIVGLSRLATIREISRRNESILRSKEQAARQSAEAESLSNQQNLYFANINLAIQSLESKGGMVLARNTVREWDPNDHPKLRTGWEWHFLAAEVNPEFQVYRSDSTIRWHDWNDDTSDPLLAFVEGDRLAVVRLPDCSLVFEKDLEHHTNCVFWPGSDTLVIGGDYGIVHLLRLNVSTPIHSWKFDSGITGIQQNFSRTKLAISTKRKIHVIRLDDRRKYQSYEVFSAEALRWQPFAWHPKNDELAVITGPHEFSIMDTEGNGIRLTAESTSAIHSIQWAHDGARVLCGESNGSIFVFDIDPPNGQSLFIHRHYVQAITRANCSSRVASGGAGRKVVLWDPRSLKQHASLSGAEDYVRQIRFTRDDKWVSALSRDNTIRIWNTPSESEAELRQLNTWAGCQHAIAIHPKTLGIYAVEDYSSIASFRQVANSQMNKKKYERDLDRQLTVPGNINAIGWAPNGDRLAWACNSCFGWFDFEANQPGLRISMDVDFPVASFGFSPNGRRIARGGLGGFDILDVESKQVVFFQSLEGGRIKAIEYTPDGKWIVAGGYGPLRVYQANPPKLVRLVETTGITTRISFAPDGKTIAVASGKGIVLLFDFESGKRIGELKGHTQSVFTVDWHPNGERIASGGSDGEVRIWDVKTQSQVLAFRREPTSVLSVEWSGDGSSLVSVTDNNEIAIRCTNYNHQSLHPR